MQKASRLQQHTQKDGSPVYVFTRECCRSHITEIWGCVLVAVFCWHASTSSAPLLCISSASEFLEPSTPYLCEAWQRHNTAASGCKLRSTNVQGEVQPSGGCETQSNHALELGNVSCMGLCAGLGPAPNCTSSRRLHSFRPTSTTG